MKKNAWKWIIAAVFLVFSVAFLINYFSDWIIPKDKQYTPGQCVYTTSFSPGSDRISTGLPLNSIWLANYTASMNAAGISSSFLTETEVYDYSSENIRQLSLNALEQPTAEEAIKYIISSTYETVQYTLKCNDCDITSASTVQQRGYGLCSTMSMVNIAALRGAGIAAKPVSGCYSDVTFCAPQQLSIFHPIKKVKVAPLYFGEVGDRFSTGVQGAHAWVEVWLPSKGWIIIESTTGYLVDKNCKNYQSYYDDAQGQDFCSLPRQEYYSCLGMF
jgi:transglutaminase-like putative cysteine protease